jgi:pyrimidine-nucleoside phosphorylase
MDQPLGRLAGHTHEVIESIEVLKGKGPKDLRDLSVELSAWMFFLGERTKSVEEGRRHAELMISSGQALEKFRDGVRLQGGDEGVVDNYALLPGAKWRTEVKSDKSGYIFATNCMEFGVALAMLGGGREKKEDKIDPGVGLQFQKRIGDKVEKGEPLVTIFYNSDAKLEEAQQRIAKAFRIEPAQPPDHPLVRRMVGV